MPDSNYDPSIEQPLIIFFNLTLGGLDRTYYQPEIPIDFEFDQQFGQAGTVKFTLFDQTGEIEDALWQCRGTQTGIAQGTFSFGYQGTSQRKSATYTFQVDNYTLAFVENAFMITVYGFFAPMTPLVSSNQNSGTVMQILQKIATTHGMTLNINPPFGTFYMQDAGYVDRDSTDLVEMRHMKWINESDHAYIERVLQWARDQNGKGGYQYTINNGVLNIIKAQNTTAQYSYTIQAHDSVVISWNPDVRWDGAIIGSNNSQQLGYGTGTGDEQKNVGDQQFTIKYQDTFSFENASTLINSTPVSTPADALTYFCSDQMPSNVTGSSSSSRPGPTSSPYAGTSPFLNHHLDSWMQQWPAELTILGDPQLDPVLNGIAQVVNITCYYPQNYKTGPSASQRLHYTSGLYMFIGVKHIIKEGEFYTILSLTRALASTPNSPNSDVPVADNTQTSVTATVVNLK